MAAVIQFPIGEGDADVGFDCVGPQGRPGELEAERAVIETRPRVSGGIQHTDVVEEVDQGEEDEGADQRVDQIAQEGAEDQPLVDYWDISDLVGAMSRETTLVALAPHTIEGILNSISTVGAYTEAEYEAIGLVEVLRERLAGIETNLPARQQLVEEPLATAPRRGGVDLVDPVAMTQALLVMVTRKAAAEGSGE